MHVAVLGAGVVGVTTAYSLVRRGCDVTVIDRAAEAAAGCSYANGGQLSWGFTDSLARPSFLPEAPAVLLGRDPAVRVRPGFRPPLAGWGIGFLRQCTPSKARGNTVALLELAMRSASALAAIVERTGVEFAWRTSGKLVLLPAGADLRAARETRDLKKRHGFDTEILTFDEASELEPALAGFTSRYAGAVHSARDAVGDARAFTAGLGEWLVRERGVRLRLGEEIRSLIVHGDAVLGVRAGTDEVRADAVVVCLGARSPLLLATAGIKARIYPVRGYSVTLPRGDGAPSVSVTDQGRRLLYSPLDGRLRIAGFADFVGFDARRDRIRVAELLSIAREVAPRAADYSVADTEPWAGSRPMTPDGRPLVGRTRRRGLYLNCGHGMLGWTLAGATAEAAADAVCAR